MGGWDQLKWQLIPTTQTEQDEINGQIEAAGRFNVGVALQQVQLLLIVSKDIVDAYLKTKPADAPRY